MAQFCTQETQQFNEPLAGSAMSFQGYIFIGWPRKEWTKHPYMGQGMPEAAADFFTRLRDERGIAVRLFHQADACEQSDIIICPRMLRLKDVPRERVIETLDKQLAGETSEVKAEQMQGKHIFMCTHGIRDKCCAKFGYGAVRAINKAIAQGLELQNTYRIWETTHLVGDRFTGTCIDFPQGNMYGRLSEHNALEFLQTIDTGQVLPQAYRGNVFLPERHQVCEAAAREFIFRQGLAGEVELNEVTEDSFDVRVLTKDKTYQARLQLGCETFRFFSNCSHLEQSQVSTKPRWVVTSGSFC